MELLKLHLICIVNCTTSKKNLLQLGRLILFYVQILNLKQRV